MESIFNYLDYRCFLKDRFADFKKTRRGFTHRSLSKKGGFASPNFLKLVMDGKRNLTEKSIGQVSHAFELSESEKKFFFSLVFFNQAKSFQEKENHYSELKKNRQNLKSKRIEHSQFEYFDQWYVTAIRELIEIENFQENPKWISEKLQKKVTPTQVQKSLDLLEKLKLIERDKNGKLKTSQTTLSTGDEVSSVAIYRYHQAMINKAKESLNETDPMNRDISSLTFALSYPLFKKIKSKIQEFRREILELASQNQNAEVVYQLNIQLFNLSEILWEKP